MGIKWVDVWEALKKGHVAESVTGWCEIDCVYVC